MAARHFSMRGEVIDMNRLRSINGTAPALGNARVNARGDILGQGGIIIKTQEQIEAEWAASKQAREASVRPADIKSENMIRPEQVNKAPMPSATDYVPQTKSTARATPAQPTPEATLPDQAVFEDTIVEQTDQQKEKPRRKISESDV